jgi:hypothetical protein
MIMRIRREVISTDEFGENLGKLPVLLKGIVLSMYSNEPLAKEIAERDGSEGIKALEKMKEIDSILKNLDKTMQELPFELREGYEYVRHITTREQLEEFVFTKVAEIEFNEKTFDEILRVFKILNVSFKLISNGIEVDLWKEQKREWRL